MTNTYFCILSQILISLFCANAEVFMRIPRSADAVLKNMGGAKVYESAVTVNGGKGQLSSFVFNERSDITAKRLAKKLKLPKPHTAAAIMLDASGRRLTRYFIVQAPNLKESTLVTALEQKAPAIRDSSSHTPAWPDNIPVLNAIPRFTAYSDKTRTTMLCAASRARSAEQALNNAASVFAGAGWERLKPGTPTFCIFSQNNKQSVIFSNINPDTGKVTINILQRKGAKQ